MGVEVGGPSCSSFVNQTCRGSAGSLSSAGGTWLLCEKLKSELFYSSTLCQVVFQVLHCANLIAVHAPTV